MEMFVNNSVPFHCHICFVLTYAGCISRHVLSRVVSHSPPCLSDSRCFPASLSLSCSAEWVVAPQCGIVVSVGLGMFGHHYSTAGQWSRGGTGRGVRESLCEVGSLSLFSYTRNYQTYELMLKSTYNKGG